RKYGPVQITEPIERPAKIAECAGEYRLLVDRKAELLSRLFQHAKIGKRQPEIVMCSGELTAALLKRRSERRDRFRKHPASIEGDAELVMRFRKVFVLRQRSSERTNRQIEFLLAGINASQLVMRVGVAAASQCDCRAEFFGGFRHSA